MLAIQKTSHNKNHISDCEIGIQTHRTLQRRCFHVYHRFSSRMEKDEMKNKTIYLYDDGIGRVEYIQHMGTEKTIVNAARVSFGQDNDNELTERDHRLIKHLIGKKHTSTLEHNVITLKFTVPLFIRSQHHRHRTWSYNEISRRYTAENMQFYSPLTFRTQHKSDRQASNQDKINPLIEVAGKVGSAPVVLHFAT
jgi:thymidylate synthase ThyX